VALIAIDLLSAGHGSLPFASRDEIFPTNRALTFLQERTRATGDRVAAVQMPYADNLESAYGLSTPLGYEVALTQSSRFLGGYLIPDASGFNLAAQQVAAVEDRRLDLLGTRYLIGVARDTQALESHPNRFVPVFSDGEIRIFENRKALNRAFFVPSSGIELIADEAAQLARLSDSTFDPERSVVLGERPRFTATAEMSGETQISGFAQTMNEIRFQANVTAPGILVVSETNFREWTVHIDGKPGTVLLANYNFLGVPIDPGPHNVTLKYSTASFRAGAVLSALFLIAAIGLRISRIGL
jgi:hypothetical protein